MSVTSEEQLAIRRSGFPTTLELHSVSTPPIPWNKEMTNNHSSENEEVFYGYDKVIVYFFGVNSSRLRFYYSPDHRRHDSPVGQRRPLV